MSDYSEILDDLKERGMYRKLRDSVPCGSHIVMEGRNLFNFASNDYLGISSRLDFQSEFLTKLCGFSEFIMGSTSSRLLGGNAPILTKLENRIASLYSGMAKLESSENSDKSCLLFNSGFCANSGVLGALAGAGDLVVCDKLIHASLIDGARLTGAVFERFPHSDLEALERILSRNRAKFRRAWVVTESVFSMDGDMSDLRSISAIAKKYDSKLYVDEAHSFGLFGEGGLGKCAELGIVGDVDLILCTLGKAAGSNGAFVICSSDTREMLINACRTVIFTTCASPIIAHWTDFILSKILTMDSEREHLRKISQKFSNRMRDISGHCAQTQIVPLLIGGGSEASEISKELFKNGIYAPAIRPPTVPKNSSRIRFSLNADFTDADIDECADKIMRIAGGRR